MEYVLWIIIYLIVLLIVAYRKMSLLLSSVIFGIVLLLQTISHTVGGGIISWVCYLLLVFFLNVNFTRMRFAKFAYGIISKTRPKMSSTEAEALNAGGIGFEGELFAGNPNFNNLLQLPIATLTEKEKAFLNGPVEEICGKLHDFDITHRLGEIPDSIMAFLGKHGFFGMIIPEKYGGLGFSPYAHSQVIVKLSGISITVATTVSVPNSLGPAELLLHYGTDEQKQHYLPRLATGKDLPCFALTSLYAGSDAASMRDYGIVCKAEYQGKDTLGIRLNFSKRYITLSPIASVLGLAFKCYDPENLLGSKEDLGITCALIPLPYEGIVRGRRHLPLNSAFQNGPIAGKDVFIPLDFIIGGKSMIGDGWRMLMECLAAGRAISLPSMVIGGAKMGTLATGAYSRNRRQFNTAIANFEGVKDQLGMLTGLTYIMESTRLFAMGQLNEGIKPSVASGICKCYITEFSRRVSTCVMDIHGGKGICLGPHNYTGRGYQEAPISITVEGANILTRSMIIFGQGAIRCHPYMLDFITADIKTKADLKKFTNTLFGYLGNVISNTCRTLVLSITAGHFTQAPKNPFKRYYQLLTRYSAAFACLADWSMLTFGGRLKFMESISGRFADCLAMMYMASAVLKNIHEQGYPEDQMDVATWSLEYLSHELVTALEGILTNYPNRFSACIARFMIFPWGKGCKPPKDTLVHQMIEKIVAPSALRDWFAEYLYMTPTENNPAGRVCDALQEIINVEPTITKFNKALKKHKLSGYTFAEWLDSAIATGLLTAQEASDCEHVDKLREEFNMVDDFDPSEIGVNHKMNHKQ